MNKEYTIKDLIDKAFDLENVYKNYHKYFTEDDIKLVTNFVMNSKGMMQTEQMAWLREQAVKKGIQPLLSVEEYQRMYAQKWESFVRSQEESWKKNPPLIAGAKELIEELAERGVELFILSGEAQELLEQRVKWLLPDVKFSGVYGCSKESPVTKAEKLKTIKKDLNIPSDQLVMFGNGKVDMEAAKQAGIKAVGIAADSQEKGFLASFDADMVTVGFNNKQIIDFMSKVLLKAAEKAEFSHTYTLILAGGGGTRAWPWSTNTQPKQLLKLFGTPHNLVQESVKRALHKLPPEQIFIQTIPQLKKLMVDAVSIFGVPADNILCEPAMADTAAAIGYGVTSIYRKDKDATIVVLTADHKIEPKEDFWSCLETSVMTAQNNPSIVCIGITPTRPHKGFGYQEGGEDTTIVGIKKLASFKEKPDLETAKKYLVSGNYRWNSGMFIFSAATMLGCFQELSQGYYRGFERMIKASDEDFDSIAAEVFEEFARYKREGCEELSIQAGKTSVDFIIMEPLSQGKSSKYNLSLIHI